MKGLLKCLHCNRLEYEDSENGLDPMFKHIMRSHPTIFANTMKPNGQKGWETIWEGK